MCILLLDRHAKLPVRNIAILLRLTPNMVSKRIRAFRLAIDGNRDEKIYGQPEFIAKFEQISKSIAEATSK